MLCVEELSMSDEQSLRGVAELEQAVFTDAWSVKEIESTVKQECSLCAVARDDQNILGYYLCYCILDECEIARIAVNQEYRRRGIGQSLFSHMLQLCRQKHVSRILLEVRESNLPAIHFYEKNGFTKDGIRKNYYEGVNPEDAILMSVCLTEECCEGMEDFT